MSFCLFLMPFMGRECKKKRGKARGDQNSRPIAICYYQGQPDTCIWEPILKVTHFHSDDAFGCVESDPWPPSLAHSPAPPPPVRPHWSDPGGRYCNEVIVLNFDSAATQIMTHLEKQTSLSGSLSVFVCSGGQRSACEILHLLLFVCVCFLGMRTGAGKWARYVQRQTNGGKVTIYTQEDTWWTLTWKVERHMHMCHFWPLTCCPCK